MTYRVDDLLADETVAFEPGTSLLLTGPAATSEPRLLDVVRGGVQREETAIIISATTGAAGVVAALRERGTLVPERVGILDCTDSGGGTHEVPVAQVSSPGDLTGISLEFVKLLRRFGEAGRDERVRVGLASISTLLIYTEVRTTFRFLHVFTSRISTADMLGVFSIDPEMHDPQTVNTVRAIFDCEARLGDDVDLRGSGFAVE